jgi:hypothetical protein
MPEELHRLLKAKAALEGRSLSAVIEDAARGVCPEVPQVVEGPAPYQRRRARRPAAMRKTV